MERRIKISIPLYVSDETIVSAPVLSSDMGYNAPRLINSLKTQIDSYNAKPGIARHKRNKSYSTNIGTVKYEDIMIGDNPGLLLRISAHQTEFYDGYYEDDEAHKELHQDSKIGSENYVVVLIPEIHGINNESFHWVIFIYEDPNKDTKDVISVVKSFLKKALNISSKPIKLREFQDKIKTELPKIIEVEYSYRITENDPETDEIIFKDYVTQSKLTTELRAKYKIPRDEAMKLINEYDTPKGLKAKIKRVFQLGSKDRNYKISKIYENGDETTQIEEVYNFEHEVDSFDDIKSKRIFDKDYIQNVIKEVYLKYKK